MTRDSVVWWVGMIGGVAGGLAASFDLFPWIPASAQHAISLVAFLAATLSGKLATSPLPHSSEVR